MHSQSRFCLAPKDDLPADVVDLAWTIGQLPHETQEYLQPALQRVLDSSQRRRRILQLIQDSLDELRLERKYLLFDLEATRRERDGIGF